jgi:CRP-like cAMP-binding protein
VAYFADGREQIGGWVMPSELFGVFNMLVPSDGSPVTLRVDTPEAHVLHFSREVLLEMMWTVPDACVGIAMGLSKRILQLHDVIDISGPRPLLDKLRAVLAWWAKQYSVPARDNSVELWMSQMDLANTVGASRQRVHMELQALQALGEVDLAYRKLIVRPKFFEQLHLYLH